jgi:hypothetical protein
LAIRRFPLHVLPHGFHRIRHRIQPALFEHWRIGMIGAFA